MLAIVPVLVVVLLSLIVTRVATIALTLTGLSRQSARFQARSALTGAGFTTTESEAVVNHPIRRRIVMWLMLIGSSTIVIVIAQLIVATVRTADQVQNLALSYAILVAGLGLIVWLFSLPKVDRGLQRVIRRVLRRYTDLDVRDYASLLHVHGDFAVSELAVAEASWLAGQTLADLRLNDEGVLILGVQRGEDYVGAPKGHTVCRPGDVLVLYGHAHRLADLDRRPSGPVGQRRHAEAVGDQQVVEASQRLVEATPPSGDGDEPSRAARS